MGPIGWQEMMFIFLLALVLFGPKKLPELGRMVGKAISEFRRAQSELKATFDREMQNLERETQLQDGVTKPSYQYDNNNYDYSSGDAGPYGEPYGATSTEPQDYTVNSTPTISASATEGAESLSTVPPEGAIAHGTETASANGHTPYAGSTPGPEAAAATPEGATETVPTASGSLATERNT